MKKNPRNLFSNYRPALSLCTASSLLLATPLSAVIVLENDFEAETVDSFPATGFTHVGTPTGVCQVEDENTSDAFGDPNKFMRVGGAGVRVATTIPGTSLAGVTQVTFDMAEPSGISGTSIIGFAANVSSLDLNAANAFCALNVNNGAISVRSSASIESGSLPTLDLDKAYRMVFTLNYSGAAASYPDPADPGGPALSLDDDRVALWIQDLETTTWSGPVIITTTGVGAPRQFMFRNFTGNANELYIDKFSVDFKAAGDRVWTGSAGDGLWSSAANWEGGEEPSAGNSLFFGPAADGNITNDLAPDISFAGLSFLPTATNYTIDGEGIALTGPVVSDSPLIQTLTLPIELATSFVVAANNGVVNFNGDISGNFDLKKSGAGTVVLEGANTYTGLTTVGAGTLEISGSNEGTAFIINADTEGAAPALILADTNSIPDTSTFTGSNAAARLGRVFLASAGDYTLGSLVRGNMAFENTSGSPATLTFTDASVLTTGNEGGRTFTNASENLTVTFASDLDIGSDNPTPNHGTINTAGEVTIEGDLLSTGSGVREFRKNGIGTLTIKGTGEHTGNTTLFAGTLVLGEFASIPNTSGFSISAGAVLDSTAQDSFTMDGSQPFTFGINPEDDGSSGTLAAQHLDITDAVVELNIPEIDEIPVTLDDPVYVLATYTSLEGTAFASEPDNIPSDYELQYDYEGNKIALVSTGTTGGFASWQTTNATTGGLADDHDHDGVPNGIEYFLGGPNGNTTGFTALPGITNTAGTLSVTWTKGPGYTGTYGTDFWVETSETLEALSWTMETEGGNVTLTGDDVTFTYPAGTKNFARLVVTGP
jgi:autotransporter-associated beta strand protein